MKKLIGLLGSLGLVAAAGVTVVSCGDNKSDKKTIKNLDIKITSNTTFGKLKEDFAKALNVDKSKISYSKADGTTDKNAKYIIDCFKGQSADGSGSYAINDIFKLVDQGIDSVLISEKSNASNAGMYYVMQDLQLDGKSPDEGTTNFTFTVKKPSEIATTVIKISNIKSISPKNFRWKNIAGPTYTETNGYDSWQTGYNVAKKSITNGTIKLETKATDQFAKEVTEKGDKITVKTPAKKGDVLQKFEIQSVNFEKSWTITFVLG